MRRFAGMWTLMVEYLSSFANFFSNAEGAIRAYWTFLTWLYAAPLAPICARSQCSTPAILSRIRFSESCTPLRSRTAGSSGFQRSCQEPFGRPERWQWLRSRLLAFWPINMAIWLPCKALRRSLLRARNTFPRSALCATAVPRRSCFHW